MSHNPIVGPLLRLVYVGIILLGINTVFRAKVPLLPLTGSLLFLFGFWIPSVVHYFVDTGLYSR